jgi:hypothetical protein
MLRRRILQRVNIDHALCIAIAIHFVSRRFISLSLLSEIRRYPISSDNPPKLNRKKKEFSESHIIAEAIRADDGSARYSDPVQPLHDFCGTFTRRKFSKYLSNKSDEFVAAIVAAETEGRAQLKLATDAESLASTNAMLKRLVIHAIESPDSRYAPLGEMHRQRRQHANLSLVV